MNPVMVVGGIGLLLAAVLVGLLVVFKPRQGAVPLSRRRPGVADRPAMAGQSTQLSKATGAAVDTINTVLHKRGVLYSTGTALELAGIRTKPADFIIWTAAVTVVAALALGILGGSFIGILALAIVPLIAVLLVRVKTGKRESEFDNQLADTLTMLAGSLRAGHSMLRAIDAGAQETDAPMSEELARVVNEARLGRDAGEALMSTAVRMHSEDFSWLAQAIQINREVGGDLAEVLDHVGDTMRDRNQIRRQARALSAEGRMSALILFCLPVVMAFGMNLINPGYFTPLFATPLGYILLAVAVALLALGGLWLRAVIKIKF